MTTLTLQQWQMLALRIYGHETWRCAEAIREGRFPPPPTPKPLKPLKWKRREYEMFGPLYG